MTTSHTSIEASVSLDGTCVEVSGPVRCDVRFQIEESDPDRLGLANLNSDDLAALYVSLTRGASRTERGEIECYLCAVAEGK